MIQPLPPPTPATLATHSAADLALRVARMWAGLWWGGVTALAFVAVPLLFARLGSPAVAGPVAASLFEVVGLFSVVSAQAGVLYFLLFCHFTLAAYRKSALILCVVAGVSALCQLGWVGPQIVGARASGGNLALWHGLGSVLVLLQWCAAVAVAWLLARQPTASGSQHVLR